MAFHMELLVSSAERHFKPQHDAKWTFVNQMGQETDLEWTIMRALCVFRIYFLSKEAAIFVGKVM